MTFSEIAAACGFANVHYFSNTFKKIIDRLSRNLKEFDRGYDNNRYYEYLISHNEKFVIRAKKNRDVIYKGERINILKLAQRFKGKYRLKFTKKNGLNNEYTEQISLYSMP